MHDASPAERVAWDKLLAPYKKADDRAAWFQLSTTFLGYVVLWVAMFHSLKIGYWLTFLIGMITAGFSTRLFIFQHDCGHGSFFRSQKLNNIVGSVLGVITFFPYAYWRRTHAIHHATAGNLDRREFGDIQTLTVKEYLELGFWGRLGYRLYRNPLVLMVIGPFYQFVLKHRLPWNTPRAWKKEWASVLWSDAALLLVLGPFILTGNFLAFVAVQMTIIGISGAIGIWLFYVQHQFEDTYWRGQKEWSFIRAGLEGSSYYDLPQILHWFTGNIGYHHIHHLSSRIPNYHLRKCQEEVPEVGQVTRLKLWESFRCAKLKLWDEQSQRLVGWKFLREMRRAQEPSIA